MLPAMTIGDKVFENVLVYATNIAETECVGDLVLGLNFLNNMFWCVNRVANEIIFDYAPTGKDNPFSCFVDGQVSAYLEDFPLGYFIYEQMSLHGDDIPIAV